MLLLVFSLQLTCTKIAASRSQRVSAAAEQLAPLPAPAPSRSEVSPRVQRLRGSLVAASLDILGFSAPLPSPAQPATARQQRIFGERFQNPFFYTGKRSCCTDTIFNRSHRNSNILYRI